MAEWIWTKFECVNQYAEFETDFEYSGKSNAILRISVDNEYAAWVNGQFAGFNQYDDFPMRKSYNEHDITSLLRDGKNTLRVAAYHQGTGSFQYIEGAAGLWFEIDADGIIAKSGAHVRARKYAMYESGEMEKVSPQLGFTFHADANAPEAEWESAVTVNERKNTELYPRPVKQLVLHEKVNEKLIRRGVYLFRDGETPAQRIQRAFIAPTDDINGADGRYFLFDLGREEAGLPYIDAESDSEAEIIVGYGQHLDDLRVRSWVGGRNFAWTIRVGRGKTEFTHLFRRIAGRYMMAFAPEGVKINRLTLIPALYPHADRGVFNGDRMMNRVYEISKRTLELCMHEHYEDTPWREQGLYAMDSRNQALAGYCAFGEYDVPAACLALMAEGQRKDGLLEICAPARASITIPSFALGWIFSLRDFALYSGRLDDVKKLIPCAEKILKFFENRMENGLIVTPREECYWNFYEWVEGMDDGWDYGKKYVSENGTRRDAPINFMLSCAYLAMGQISKWLGEADAENAYESKRIALNKACDRAFWDEPKNVYRSFTNVPPHYCELTQSLALLCGAADGKRARHLREVLSGENNLIKVTLSYAMFKYEALIADDDFRRAAVEDCLKLWGGMVEHGATSFWETILGADDFNDAGSLCHGWSAVPAWLWVAGYLGIEPTSPSFKTYKFNPMESANAHAVIPTPSGEIVINGNEIIS